MVHATLPYDCTGDRDLVRCEHDQKASISQVGNVEGGQTRLVIPGAVGGPGAIST